MTAIQQPGSGKLDDPDAGDFTLVGAVLPAVFLELAEGVSPAVAWRYRELADRYENSDEEEERLAA